MKVEMLIQVCINGRPIWRKARAMRSELSQMMTDAEYDLVLKASVSELDRQVTAFQVREKKKKDEAAKS